MRISGARAPDGSGNPLALRRRGMRGRLAAAGGQTAFGPYDPSARRVIDAMLPASLSGEPTPALLERLTPAERQVFDLAIEGLSTRAIADKLILSEATIRSHLTRIYAKLGARGRVELLATVPRAAPRRSGHDLGPTGDMPGEASPGSSLKSNEQGGFVNGRSGRERLSLGIVVLLIVLGLMLALPGFYFVCGVLGVCGAFGL